MWLGRLGRVNAWIIAGAVSRCVALRPACAREALPEAQSVLQRDREKCPQPWVFNELFPSTMTWQATHLLVRHSVAAGLPPALSELHTGLAAVQRLRTAPVAVRELHTGQAAVRELHTGLAAVQGLHTAPVAEWELHTGQAVVVEHRRGWHPVAAVAVRHKDWPLAAGVVPHKDWHLAAAAGHRKGWLQAAVAEHQRRLLEEHLHTTCVSSTQVEQSRR